MKNDLHYSLERKNVTLLYIDTSTTNQINSEVNKQKEVISVD